MGSVEIMGLPKYIVIHHTEGPKLSGWEAIERLHKKRDANPKDFDFPVSSMGYYAGYTYAIEAGGYVKQFRTDTETQAHTIVKGGPDYNNMSIGICLIGNFDKFLPTREQKEALGQLLRAKMAAYGINRSMVVRHGDLKPKTCPGKNVGLEYIYDTIDSWHTSSEG